MVDVLAHACVFVCLPATKTFNEPLDEFSENSQLFTANYISESTQFKMAVTAYQF